MTDASKPVCRWCAEGVEFLRTPVPRRLHRVGGLAFPCTATAPSVDNSHAIADAPYEAGKLRISVDDDFRVCIQATRLDQAGIERLIRWLDAHKGLAPDGT